MRHQLIATERVGPDALVRQPLLPPGVSAPSVEVGRHTFVFDAVGETAGWTVAHEVRVVGVHAPAIMPALAGGIAPSDRAHVGAETFNGPAEALVAPHGSAVVLSRYPSGFLVVELSRGRTFRIDERPIGFVERGRALLVRGPGHGLARIDIETGAFTALAERLTYDEERVELGGSESAHAIVARRDGSLELVDGVRVVDRMSDARACYGDLFVFAREPLGVHVYAPQTERVLTLSAIPEDAPRDRAPLASAPPPEPIAPPKQVTYREPAKRVPKPPSPPDDKAEPTPRRRLAGIGCATPWLVAALAGALRWSAGLGLPHLGYLVFFAGVGSLVAGIFLAATDDPDAGTWENMDPNDPVQRRAWNVTGLALGVLFGALAALVDLVR